MTNKASITMDYACGVPVTDIAEQAGLSKQRVYQIIEEMLAKAGATKDTPKEHLGLFLFRRWEPYRAGGGYQDNSPAAFYWEELAHNQGETYGL